jgi:hypothetical protein
MTIADAILAVVLVIAAVAGFRAGATTGLTFASTASLGLVVGARVADQIHWGVGTGRQAVAALVLLGCGAIGLAGGQLLRVAPSPSPAQARQPTVPAFIRRRRRRRWEIVGRTALTLLVGAAGGFLIAKATESDRTLTTSSVVTLPATTAVTTAPPTTVVHSTFPSTASTVGTATTRPATTSSAAPVITPLALSVTSPSDGTVVTTDRVTLTGTAEPGAIVKVGTVAVTASADTTWRVVVRVDEGVNQVVVTDGSSSVTITVVFNAPSTTTTPTSTATSTATTVPPPPPPTTTTIPVDTEPKP